MIRPISIQTKLLGVFLVAAALPLALVSLIGYHNSNKAVEEMVGNRTEKIARSVGEELSGKLRRRLNDRLLMVNEPVQSFLYAVNYEKLKVQITASRKLTQYSESLTQEYERYYRQMLLADASGNLVYRFGSSTGHSGRFRESVPGAPPLPSPDSLLVPEEIPLPGQAEELQEYRRALKAQFDASARDFEDIDEDLAQQGDTLPPDEANDILDTLTQLEAFAQDDPTYSGPSQRLVRPFLSGRFTHDDEQAARNGLLFPPGTNQLFIHRTPEGDAEAVRIVRPVFSVKEPDVRLGVMLLDLRLDYLFPEDLGTERFGSKGELAIINTGNGEVLFHSRPELGGKDVRLVSPAMAEALRKKREETVDTSTWMEINDEQGQRFASLVDIGLAIDWTVVATAFPREFTTETRQAGMLNLLIASIAIMLALVVLIGSSRRISSSIHKVTQGAREIATGNLSHSIRVNTHDEIQTLADTFNSMTASLRENISLREKAATELEALNRTLEDRVQERTQELVALNEALNQANQELKDLDRLKSNFLATVSHEFRTPLTSITAFSEILIDEMAETKASEEVKRFLNIINAESERLGRLIKNLLDLSRIEAGRMRWDRGVFLVGDVLRAARDGLIPVFAERDIQVIPEFACPEARVNADRDRIQQVTTNLMENAVKFSHKGNRIWISCNLVPGDSNGQPFIKITVRDEGPGIPPDHLVRIFERFSQVDSTDTRGTGGSGLGLAISKEIVEHHGGRIWAESEEGNGASFHYTLPLLDREAPVPDSGTPGVDELPRTTKEMKHG